MDAQARGIIEAYYRKWQRITGGDDIDVAADCWGAYQCYLNIKEASGVRLEYDDIAPLTRTEGGCC